MSVQLILYPQRQITTNEYVVNGITFNNFNNTTVYSTTAALPDQDAIICLLYTSPSPRD